jgi:IclR family KDG regulon transcriptional repressor
MDNFEHTPKYPVQTLGKALDILNYIKDNPSAEGVSLSEISRELGIGKSGVHRLLDTLMAYNFIEKNSTNATSYRLGWGLYQAGNAVPKQHILSGSNYIGIMERLCKTFSETVNLGLFNNYETIIIHQIEPNRMLRTNTQVGEREPLYCTALGKLFLSQMENDEVLKYYERIKPEKKAANTIISAEEMLEEMARVRKNGFSLDNEEYVDGMTCVAVPVRDFRGKISYGISVSGPTGRMTEEKRREIIGELEKACGEIAAFLGYNV